jgi:hypothetical protein
MISKQKDLNNSHFKCKISSHLIQNLKENLLEDKAQPIIWPKRKQIQKET